MATRIGVAIPDRASLALANIMRGSPDAFARSLVSPDTLTPREHKDLIEQWFGEGESVPKSIARFFTNPMTIGAVALALHWPAPSMERLKPTMKSLANYDRYMPGILRKLSGLFEIFHNTGVDDAFSYATRERAAFHNKFTGPGLGLALDEFSKATGGTLPAPIRQIAMGYHWDMSQPEHAVKLSKFLNNELERVGSSIRLDAGDLAPLKELAAPETQMLQTTQRGTTSRLWGIVEEAHKNGSLKDLQRDLYHSSIDLSENLSKRVRAAKRATGDLPTRIENWYPHVVHRGQDEIKAGFADAGREALGRTAQRGINAGAPGRQTAGQYVERYNRMVPNAKHVRMLAEKGEVSRKFADALDQIKMLRSPGLDPIREYDLRVVHTVERASDAMGRAYVWRVKRDHYKESVGTWVNQRTNELATSSNQSNQRNAQLLMDTYIPAVLGRSSVEQYSRGLEWGSLRNWTAKMLESPKVQKTIGPDLTKRLNEMLHYGTGFASWHQAGGKMASWFYLTTLGFNPATAAQNLLQSVLTTGSIVDPKFMMQGLEKVGRDFPKMRAAMSRGMTEHEALGKFFPDFAGQGLELEPLFAEAIHGAKEVTPGLLRAEAAKSGLSKLSKSFTEKALGLFGLTERFNHLLAFYSAHPQAVAEGFGSQAAEIAAKATRLGQLWAGPFSIPSGLVNLPAPLRQFTTFPAKIANFLALSAAGGLPNVGPGGVFHPGTLGRAVLGSTAAYEAGRGVLGTDLSGALLFGAAPGPSERGPFAPLPVVPPVLALAGAAGLDLARGEFNETKRVLPLLIPGGVAGARALPMLAGRFSPGAGEAVGRALGRPYADYSRPAPDGRIAVHTADGSLVGNFTPVEIMRRALGLGGEDAADEQTFTKYLVRQRDQIRDYRRRYVKARVEHDPDKAERLNNDYVGRFGIGPIQYKDADRRAFTMRNDISRLERIMETVPPEARGLYGGLISAAFANAGPHMLGVDPAMLGTGTARTRHPGLF